MSIGFDPPDMDDPRRQRPTIAICFEQVIYDYKNDNDPDAPVAEAISSIAFLMELFNVYVLTTSDPFKVAEWLGRHGGWNVRVDMDAARKDRKRDGWHDPDWLLVTDTYLPCLALVGANAISFGSWDDVLGEIGAVAGPEIMKQAGPAMERAAARDDIKRLLQNAYPKLVMENRPVDEGHAFVIDLPEENMRLRVTVTEEK